MFGVFKKVKKSGAYYRQAKKSRIEFEANVERCKEQLLQSLRNGTMCDAPAAVVATIIHLVHHKAIQTVIVKHMQTFTIASASRQLMTETSTSATTMAWMSSM